MKFQIFSFLMFLRLSLVVKSFSEILLLFWIGASRFSANFLAHSNLNLELPRFFE